MLVTTFLAVLILALAIGNAFLSLTDPKRLQQKMLKESNSFPQGSEGLDAQDSFNGEIPEMQGSQSFQKPAKKRQSQDISFELAAERERIAHLNKRISRLEQLLLKINNPKFVAQKINGTNLGQKLSDLEQFKQNTKLEIAALRQRLDKIQPVKNKRKPRIPNIGDRKLREIVFRASR